MPGDLLSKARSLAKKHGLQGGFSEDIKITSKDGLTVIDIKGLHTKHWMSFDTDGNTVNQKNAHILVSESDFPEEIPTRNEDTGNVDLNGLKIEVMDSTEEVKNYVIIESYPSETFGLIACILGDAE